MSRDRWLHIWEIFEQALEQPVDQQRAWLDQACGDDSELRQAVEQMLEADRRADSLLDHPIATPGGGSTATADRAVPATAALTAGSTIGAYRILRQVGQGAMSTVYLAVRADDAFKRRVVVKLVRAGMESSSILDRLITERQILASLDHPHIAKLYDGGTTENGLPYFVLEYIEGVPIDVYCEQNQLSIDECLSLFRKVCSAVHYAHQNLVVHRDIKPSNILVDPDGQPKLLDFGIAKLLNPELASPDLEPTAIWHRVLTPNYASPEQFNGQPISTASDVYSLGVLLYKLLTGSLPRSFSGRSLAEIAKIVTETEPQPPSHAVHQPRGTADEDRGPQESTVDKRQDERPYKVLSGDLDAIVLKALRNAPIRRYGSVEQLAADLERYQLGLPVEARARNWRYDAGKFISRHRRLVALLVAVALLIVGFGVAMAVQTTRIAFERDQARLESQKKAQVLSLILELFRYSNPYVVPGQELTVREALGRSVPVLESGLAGQPAVRAELLHTSGAILSILGLYETARGQLEEALEIRRHLYGEQHPDVVATMTALAAAHKELGDFDSAEQLVRSAVGIARDLKGSAELDLPGSPLVASPLAETLEELVSVLCYRNEYDAAEELAHEALALASALPAGSQQRILVLEHLARIRANQGDYNEALRLNREALALRRARYGERHPDLIPALNNLGMNLRRTDELDSAERTYLEALDLHRETFGSEHVDPYLLNNIAGVRLARGDGAGAEELLLEARQAVEKSHGPRYWMVFFFELRLARARLGQGEAEKVELDLRQLLDSWRPQIGDHWRFAEGLSLLGQSLSAQGRCAAAEPLLVDSFEQLLREASTGIQQSAFDRLRRHFERCGEPKNRTLRGDPRHRAPYSRARARITPRHLIFEPSPNTKSTSGLSRPK